MIMGGKKRPAGRPADLPAEKIQELGILEFWNFYIGLNLGWGYYINNGK